MSCLQCQCVSRVPHTHGVSDPEDLGRCQIFAFVLFCDVFWNRSCTRFMKVNSVVNDLKGRIMINVQMMSLFVSSHPSVNQIYDSHSFSQGHGQAFGSFFIGRNCATI